MKTKTFFTSAGTIWLVGFALGGNAYAIDETQSASIDVSADNFACVNDMTKVRHFFVDNLLGDLEGTLAAANSPSTNRSDGQTQSRIQRSNSGLGVFRTQGFRGWDGDR